MKANTQIARNEAKALIEKLGRRNILNMHITEVMERTGVSCCEMQNALSYFDFSSSQAKFRAIYY